MTKIKVLPKIILPREVVQNKIFLLRGKKVMFDKDLAELYGVETEHLKRQVRRNMERFPADFLLTLTKPEAANLIHHFGGSKWGGTRKPPFAFTEHGILMLSSVLNSKRAIQVNIQIMLAFTKLRKMLSGHKNLRRKIEEMPACRQAGRKNMTASSRLSFKLSKNCLSRQLQSLNVPSAFIRKARGDLIPKFRPGWWR